MFLLLAHGVGCCSRCRRQLILFLPCFPSMPTPLPMLERAFFQEARISMGLGAKAPTQRLGAWGLGAATSDRCYIPFSAWCCHEPLLLPCVSGLQG